MATRCVVCYAWVTTDGVQHACPGTPTNRGEDSGGDGVMDEVTVRGVAVESRGRGG